jgi:hypothetical protein
MIGRHWRERTGKYGLRRYKNCGKSNCGQSKAQHVNSPERRDQTSNRCRQLRRTDVLTIRNASYVRVAPPHLSLVAIGA